jgi:hypothetical protein
MTDSTQVSVADEPAGAGPRPPSPTEFGSMPIDPIYAWSIVLEPAETLITHTSAFIERLARETYQRGDEFDDRELEARFLGFFDRLVKEGILTRLPDADPSMGRQILGPKRWLRAQRIRISRLVGYWREHEGPPPTSAKKP